jgi:hypothetical protein
LLVFLAVFRNARKKIYADDGFGGAQHPMLKALENHGEHLDAYAREC